MLSRMSANKKELLLQAAKELFGQYGYADTTFKKISTRAGVALGLLTHHYGNKEKLFLTAGLDVLENFLTKLRAACAEGKTGYESVEKFCKSYLEFSIDPGSNWLVLVRCSPYSDMKTTADRDIMISEFIKVPQELEREIRRGMEDGSIRELPVHETAQIILALMVGSNRTRTLTPYAPPRLYDEVITFIERSIRA